MLDSRKLLLVTVFLALASQPGILPQGSGWSNGVTSVRDGSVANGRGGEISVILGMRHEHTAAPDNTEWSND